MQTIIDSAIFIVLLMVVFGAFYALFQRKN